MIQGESIMGCRKNIRNMTASEKEAFVNAVLELKNQGKYDKYADMHEVRFPYMHGTPIFTSWHRQFLLDLEMELQDIDSSVNIPYWDWTNTNLNSDGTESIIWNDDFMGSPGDSANGQQISGPFSGWGLRRNSFDKFSAAGNLSNITDAMDLVPYEGVFGTDFRPTIERPHGSTHVWVGGNMVTRRSPEDPSFFLLHCNIDRIWAEWMEMHEDNPSWVAFEGNGDPVQAPTASLWPWNGSAPAISPWNTSPEIISSTDLLDHRALGYGYDTIDADMCATKSRLKERLPKERLPKEFLPKEFIPKEHLGKERLPKEFIPKEKLGKERLPKEFTPKERLPKEFVPKENLGKEGSPKEFMPKENFPKESKDIVENDHFIPSDLRPDLDDAALNFEPSADALGLSNRLTARAMRVRGNPRLSILRKRRQ